MGSRAHTLRSLLLRGLESPADIGSSLPEPLAPGAFPLLGIPVVSSGVHPPAPALMCNAGGTAQGEICLANSRASSGRKRPQPPALPAPYFGRGGYTPRGSSHPVHPSSQEVFLLVHKGPGFLPRGRSFISSQREFLGFLGNLWDRKFSPRSDLMPCYPCWSRLVTRPIPSSSPAWSKQCLEPGSELTAEYRFL